jgi:hypothetical protein
MAKRPTNQLKESDWHINSGASQHFNRQGWFTEYTTCSSKDLAIFDGGEEYTMVGKGHVYIIFGGKIMIFLLIYIVCRAWSLIHYQLVKL